MTDTGPHARKMWLLQNSNQLFQKLGDPAIRQITADADQFPLYGKSENTDDIFHDLAMQLGFASPRFRFETFEDLRNMQNVPYRMRESPVDVEVIRLGETGSYSVHIAKSVLDSMDLVVAAVYAMVKVKAAEKMGIDDENADAKLPKAFLELIAVHLGYGGLLLKHGNHVEIKSDGRWQKTSVRKTRIPVQEIAYTMAATFSVEELEPVIGIDAGIARLIREGLEEYAADIAAEGPEFLEAKKQFRRKMLHKANSLGKGHAYQNQIPCLLEGYRASPKDAIGGVFCNNLGYAYLRSGNRVEARKYLSEARELIADKPYVHNNLCLLHLIEGEIGAAATVLGEIRTRGIGNEYTLRNEAILRMLKSDHVAAEKLFSEAAATGLPIDLLDYYLSVFYAKVGDHARADKHLAKARSANDVP